MTARPRFQGLLAATFTPLTEDGDLALERVPGIVEHLLADGVAGLFVSGTTGEGESLTLDERRAIAEAYVAAAAGRVPVIVSVGRNSLREARGLAGHAAAIGVDAIAAAATTFFRPATEDLLAGALAEIGSGAPDVPLYYYHVPRVTQVDLDVPTLFDLAPERLPSFAGVKFSALDVFGLQRCLAHPAGYDVLWGVDECLLTGLGTGARGAVGSTYNFAAPLYRRLLEAHARGDLAQAERAQALAVRMVDVLVAHGALPAFKATMGLLGIDCGPVRAPLRALDESARERLRADLDAIGFFDWGRGGPLPAGPEGER